MLDLLFFARLVVYYVAGLSAGWVLPFGLVAKFDAGLVAG